MRRLTIVNRLPFYSVNISPLNIESYEGLFTLDSMIYAHIYYIYLSYYPSIFRLFRPLVR